MGVETADNESSVVDLLKQKAEEGLQKSTLQGDFEAMAGEYKAFYDGEKARISELSPIQLDLLKQKIELAKREKQLNKEFDISAHLKTELDSIDEMKVADANEALEVAKQKLEEFKTSVAEGGEKIQNKALAGMVRKVSEGVPFIGPLGGEWLAEKIEKGELTGPLAIGVGLGTLLLLGGTTIFAGAPGVVGVSGAVAISAIGNFALAKGLGLDWKAPDWMSNLFRGNTKGAAGSDGGSGSEGGEDNGSGDTAIDIEADLAGVDEKPEKSKDSAMEDEEEAVPVDHETKEVLKKPAQHLGLALLYELSGVDVETNNSNSGVYEDMGSYTFSEIEDLVNRYSNNKGDLINAIDDEGNSVFGNITKQSFKGKEENVYDVLMRLTGKYSATILNDKLNQDNLVKVVEKYDFEEKGLLSGEVISQINTGKGYTELAMEDVSVLLIYSLPVLGVLATTQLSSGLKGEVEAVFGGELGGLSEELEDIQDRTLSKHTIAFFAKKGLNNFGGNGLLNVSTENLIKDRDFIDINSEDRGRVEADIGNIKAFKENQLASYYERVLAIEGLSLDDSEKSNITQAITQNINYKYLIEAYLLFGGEDGIDVSKVTDESVDIGVIGIWMRSILNHKSSVIAYRTLEAALIKKYTSEGVDESEKGPLSIILEKILGNKLKEYYANIKGGAAASLEFIEGHEVIAGGILSTIALFYFKRARILGSIALVGAIYFFGSSGMKKIKNDYESEYQMVHDILTDDGKDQNAVDSITAAEEGKTLSVVESIFKGAVTL